MSIFSSVRVNKPKRNVFSLSHERKTTFNMGQLIPILTIPCLPGDSHKCSAEVFLRFAPMLAPIMHRVDLMTYYFFVPYRLIDKNWEEFITGGPDGNSQVMLPRIKFTNSGLLSVGSLSDHLGVHSGSNFGSQSEPFDGISVTVSSYPFSAYNLIYNEYFRDQNLTNPVFIPPIDGNSDWQGINVDSDYDEPDGDSAFDTSVFAPADEYFTIKSKAWRKDYFTSALPWTQRGAEMKLPIAGTLPINFRANSTDSIIVAGGTGGGDFLLGAQELSNDTNYSASLASTDAQGGIRFFDDFALDNSKNLTADLSDASAVTINDLRRVVAIQRWLEANARGGARYVEQLLMHFGVTPQDARLQRPEFLGGGKSPVVISEVLQQSASTASGTDTAQGNMAGHGLASMANHAFTYHCKEHGLIMGIMCVMPKSAYMQGIPREFLKTDKFDFGWPELAHLGEQEIWQAELYANDAKVVSGQAVQNYDNTTNPEERVFGYTPRYAEYKYMPDIVCGEFRSSLNFWHMSRNFLSAPVLNNSFVTAEPTSRIFAVENAGNGTSSYIDHVFGQIYFNIKSIRPLPKYGTPGTL